MSDAWKPSVRIWKWEDAPEEFKSLIVPFGGPFGEEESVFYVPPELLDEDGEYDSKSSGLWFLDEPQRIDERGHIISRGAGDDFGEYFMFKVPNGGKVAITLESVRR